MMTTPDALRELARQVATQLVADELHTLASGGIAITVHVAAALPDPDTRAAAACDEPGGSPKRRALPPKRPATAPATKKAGWSAAHRANFTKAMRAKRAGVDRVAGAERTSVRRVYRGGVPGKGSYRGMAYDRKQWSLNNLCAALEQHAATLAIRYGWAFDAETAGFPWVLYVDLPTGQVSFHAPGRGVGPEYVWPWDGVRDAAPGRICRWVALLVGATEVRT